MSNYRAPAIHPETGVEQMADWLPHYYGRRHGAVRFDDGKVFEIEVVQREMFLFRLEKKVAAVTSEWPDWKHCVLRNSFRAENDTPREPLTDCLRRVVGEE